jgi:putative ABC transport system permease protein
MLDDLDQDIRDHIERETQENIDRGMPPEESRYAALRKFGNVARVKEETWEVWSFPWVEQLFVDVRYGIRTMRNRPGFAIVAVLTLALGVGANTAAYSTIHGTLRLPYANADRMVVVRREHPRLPYYSLSWRDFRYLRGHNTSFAEMAGIFTTRMTWQGRDQTEDVNIGLITYGYFRMYQISPIIGRAFVAADHEQGSESVCALGENFWRNELKSDPSIVGKPLNLNGKNCNIIGVMPKIIPDSNHPAKVWMPMDLNLPFREPDSEFMLVVGLLKYGVSLPEGQTELRGLQAQINEQFKEHAHSVRLQPLTEFVFGDLRSVMYVLSAAAGFILLIGCVNLANMLLARAVDRTQELAVRYALGASRARLFRQTLTESLLLSMCGACLGLVFAVILTHIPVAAWPKGFLQPASAHLDSKVFGFAALLALMTGVLFGVVPALHLVREQNGSALPKGRTTTNSREQNRNGSILVIVEIALCMLLVTGALNMTFYFGHLIHTDPGMNPRNVLSMAVSLTDDQYSKPESKLRFYKTLFDKLSVLPGVKSVAGALVPPFWGVAPNGKFNYDDQPGGNADTDLVAHFIYVTPGYFATMQTPILQGRDFDFQDRLDSPKVALINRGMAEKLWPGRSAIGKSIRCGSKDSNFVIIGITSDVPFLGLAQPIGYQIYASINQNPPSGLSLLLRTREEPLGYVESVRRAILSIDRGRAISNITSVQALAEETIAGERTSTVVITILGALALLLAAIGIYGVIAYAVSRREREFGIRIALGSKRSNILILLFKRVLSLVLAGVVLGACLSYAMRAWIASLLGASHDNIYALAVSGLLLCFVAAIATFIPSRRASCINPIQALRSE